MGRAPFKFGRCARVVLTAYRVDAGGVAELERAVEIDRPLPKQPSAATLLRRMASSMTKRRPAK